MDYVTPKNIASPMTGALCKPRLMKFTRGGKIYEEAHWYCPDTGQFIMKGVVSVEDRVKPDTDQKVETTE